MTLFNLKQVTLDRKKKLSESALWQFQRDYFEQKGVGAWSGEVPYYVTSNPFIAHCYARITLRFIQEWVRKYPEAQNDPFYVLELGTGCGQVSFYILKQIKALQKQLQLEHLSICYVMTDFTDSNLAFWNQQPQLQPFITEKRLDFAIFDMEKDVSVRLHKSGITLSSGSLQNPIVVYANYIFDTVPSDAFIIEDQKIYASLVSLSTERQNMEKGKPISMDKIQFVYKKVPVEKKYYKNDIFNQVLHAYKNSLQKSHILFPITALKAIDHLKKLSSEKIVLLSSDKGHISTEELEGLPQPHVSFHGSFSLMVNFHAIAEYFQQSGGNALLQTARSGIKTNVFYQGFNLTEYPEWALSIQDHVEQLSPADYFLLHRNIADHFRQMAVKNVISHLALSHWDPHIYQKISAHIKANMVTADHKTVTYLINHLDNLADHFYQMPGAYDVFYDLGNLCQLLNHPVDAIKYYEQSLHYFGETDELLYDLNFCKRVLT